MIFGITGGSGCGKTTLLNLIGEAGGMILDCDAIYHELLQTDGALLAAIDRRFPGTVTNGTLQRKKLGAIVFADPAALADLNSITHKAVKKQVLARLSTAPALAAIDAIALHEAGLAEVCDVTVAVTAPKEARIARLTARDGISAAYAQNRVDAQHTDAWFCRMCDRTLTNDDTPETFREKCIAFLAEYGIMI